LIMSSVLSFVHKSPNAFASSKVSSIKAMGKIFSPQGRLTSQVKILSDAFRLDDKKRPDSWRLFDREHKAEDLARKAGVSPSLKAILIALVPLGTMRQGFLSWQKSFIKHIDTYRLRHGMRGISETAIAGKAHPISKNKKVNINKLKNETRFFHFLSGEEWRELKQKPLTAQSKKVSVFNVFNLPN
jgi:hypothetical protein